MQRLTAVLCCSLLALVLVPGVAFAHASFDLGQVPAESEQDLTLRVPIERDALNDRIAVLVPTGFEVTDCAGAEGWDCGTEPSDDGTVVSLTRTAEEAGTTDEFGLSLVAPSDEGVYPFPVVQTYDDDEEVAWVNEPGSDRPAPRIQVGDSDAEVEQAEAPTHNSPEDVEETPTAAPTTAEPNTPTTPTDDATAAPTEDTTADEASSEQPTAEETEAVAQDDAGAEDDGDNGLLIVLLGTAVVLAVIAGVAMRQQRSSDDA